MGKQYFNPLTVGNRAKRQRERRGISIEKMGKLAGLNKNTVVRFEKGRPTNTQTIFKICEVLETTPFHLMEDNLTNDIDYRLVKKKDRKQIKRKDRAFTNDVEDEMLVGDLEYRLPGGEMNAYVFEIMGEGRWRTHDGEEMIFCLTGKIGVRVANEEFFLEKGDAIFFWGEERHQYFNAHKDKKSVALIVWNDSEARLDNIEHFVK